MSTDSTTTPEALLRQTLARLDAGALGIALGVVSGGGLFLATTVLLVKGGPDVGRTLNLLGQYFPGYRVSWPGAVIGLGYGFLTGFVAGWTFAVVRNAIARLYVLLARARAAATAARSFFDNV